MSGLLGKLCGSRRKMPIESCTRERQPGDEQWTLILAQPERAEQVQLVCEKLELKAEVLQSTAQALHCVAQLQHELVCVVAALGISEEDSCWPLLEVLSDCKHVFKIVFSDTAANDAKRRMDCFAAGANMVTCQLPDVKVALNNVARSLQDYGSCSCPTCGLPSLSENALHLHMAFYHAVHMTPMYGRCPICKKDVNDMPVHIHNSHGPPEEREPQFAPYAAFAWCVCRRADGKFLLVNEPAGISRGRPGYWLPAGRVDVGETLVEAAVREAMEEAGIMVRVTGLLKIQIDDLETFRVVFLCEPVNEKRSQPKNVPDWESVGAVWVDVGQLNELSREDYRNPDPADLYPKVASGELQPHSLDTPSFQRLEQAVKKLTKGNIGYLNEVPKIIEALKKDYPPTVIL
eukprot:TRINITY_DN67394_c0_g1_i1.p1 TRINITY_DN67394_c0_g1~~TRINITY_DN67394_c0_g1_i1.p1  ORF type:complete len:404 (+),score=54.10 TRINITY_DN67394_c0_g1_i1:56-1267(+)